MAQLDKAQHIESLLRDVCVQRDVSSRLELIGTLKQICLEDPASVARHRQSIRRMAAEAALEDVREACCEILKAGGIKQVSEDSPSLYISPDVFPSYRFMNDETRDLLEEIFFHNGRVLHFERVMATHPIFLQSFYTTYTHLLWEPGPLLMQWRPFILVMGAAQQNCQYLVEVFERMFLEGGGDASWLQGLEHTPIKLQRLLPVTMLLARRPWCLSPEHIRLLVQGELEDERGALWSNGELAQAIALATTAHFLASFVFGVGVSPEIDSATYSEAYTAAPESPCSIPDLRGSRQETDEESTRCVLEKLKTGVCQWKCDEEVDMLEEFAKAGEGAETGSDDEKDGESPMQSSMLKYLVIGEDAEASKIRHQDFNCGSKEYDILHIEDYNWEDNAVPQLDRCYRGSGSLLESEFRTIYELTYRTFSTEMEMDTQPFRRAIWFYVLRISGIFSDQYDYQEVNQMLVRGLKTYCKKACFTPTLLTFEGFLDFGVNLQPEEKCHALMIALEARKQSSLLWALRAMSQCK